MSYLWRAVILLTSAVLLFTGTFSALRREKREEVSYLRRPYNSAFYHRGSQAYRIGAAIHFAHDRQHDVLQLPP